MSKPNQLRAGVVLSYLNMGLGSLIPFFYTPIMLRLLGQSEYGLYGLASSVTGYLSLLSFGLGSTIVRYLSMYRANGEKEQEERTMGLFILLYSAVGVLVLIGGWILSNNVEPIFHRGLTGDELIKIRALVQIMAFNLAISFPISVFGSVIVAHERYVYRQCINLFSTVAAPCANLVALFLGYASVGMAVAGTVMQVVMLPLYVVYCVRHIGLRPRFSRMPAGLIKEMFGFTAFVFLGSVVDMLFWATDKVILGMEASTAAIAVYNIGVTFNSMMTNLSSAVSGVLQPRVTVMVTQEATSDQLTELFIRVGRLQYLIIALALSGFAVFGRQFLHIWAGDGYADSYWIALITLIPLTVPLIQNTGINIVMAQNKHKFRSIVYLVIAILNVISTYLIVPYLGGFGAALCSGVSYLLGQGIIMNWFYWKKTKINIPLFWKNILKMSIFPIGWMLLGLFSSRYIVYDANWLAFFAGVLVYAAIYAVGMYAFCMNEYEKSVVLGVVNKIARPIKRLAGRR